MTEQFQQITSQELSGTARSRIDHLLSQYNAIRKKHNFKKITRKTIKQLPQEEIAQLLSIFKEIHNIKKTGGIFEPEFVDTHEDENEYGDEHAHEYENQHNAKIKGKFSCGRAILEFKNGKCILIDHKGNIVYGPSNSILDINEDRVRVYDDSYNHILIDIDGTVIAGPAEDICTVKCNRSRIQTEDESIAINQHGEKIFGPMPFLEPLEKDGKFLGEESNGIYHIYDKNGKILHGPYSDIQALNQHTEPCIVLTKADGSVELTDMNGSITTDTTPFMIDGRAVLTTKDEKMYLVDENLNIIGGPYEGCVQEHKDGRFIISSMTDTFAIDRNGNKRSV